MRLDSSMRGKTNESGCSAIRLKPACNGGARLRSNSADDRFHLYGNPTTQASDRRRSSGSREPIPKKKWERREPAPVRKIGKFSERLRLRCNGFGFGKLRDDAELLHKAQSVPVDPAFCHLASTEAGDAYPGDGDLLPRWRNPAEIAFMRTPTGPTGNHSFAFGNDVLDRQSKVGESSAVERRSFLFTLRATPKIGLRSVMMFAVGGKELVCY